MINQHFNIISSDSSLNDPKEDRLGYYPFAENVAECISKMSPNEGFVIAIYGQWGSGKSTLLNFILYHIRQLPEGSQPIVVRFNPWWFSGQEDLTVRFFMQLRAVLDKEGFSKDDVTKMIADLSDIVSEIPIIPYASSAKVLSKLIRPKPKDLTDLKEKIAKSLLEENKKILVIIDDIDRLNSEEIRQIFRVIKAVADFPNIIYLLAFDKRVAVEALKSTQGISGEDYLEKIVQVPFELPIPDKYSLRNLLLKKIDQILGESPNELFDKNYWSRVYLEGIEPFIDTPRDIVRLTNTLSVTYPSVKGEVNPVDFIAIETIRVFCPVIYDLIRKNEKMFITTADFDQRLFDNSPSAIEAYKKFHEQALLMVSEENKSQIKSLLSYIFPKYAAIQSAANRIDIPYVESGCRKHFRICSAEIFPRYFQLAISKGDISDAEFRLILELAKNRDEFGRRLVDLANQETSDGTTRARIFLRRFDDYIGTIPKDNVPIIVQTLCNIGDELCRPEDQMPITLGIRNGFLIEAAIIKLLYKYDDEYGLKIRYETLLKAILDGQAVSIVTELVEQLEMQHRENQGQQLIEREVPLINKDQVLALKRIVIEKIRRFAQDGTLLKIPEFVYILKLWLNWDEEYLVKEWVKITISTDQKLITFIEKFLNKGTSNGEISYRLDYEGLTLFIDNMPHFIDQIQK
jgi:predicted KAP-like P-loop ATPase